MSRSSAVFTNITGNVLTNLDQFHQILSEQKPSELILTIPGLPQDQGVIHGVTTRELGNFGFITLSDGVKAPELVASILHGMDEVARFSQEREATSTATKKPLLIVNETAYASLAAPGLLKDAEGKPQLILSLTERNIEQFINEHRFPETGDFADLHDKCIRVPADGFVSNLSEYRDYQLYFAINTADAPPVVLYDKQTGVIGILSCAWHNVAKGELDLVIQKMLALGAEPSQICMGIGPGLGAKSFEFGSNDAKKFYEPGILDARDDRPFLGRASLKQFVNSHPSNAEKSLINLPGMLAEIAREHGVPSNQIHYDLSWDSMTNTRFFSARRSTSPEEQKAEALKKYPKTGRGIMFIHKLAIENRNAKSAGSPSAATSEIEYRR